MVLTIFSCFLPELNRVAASQVGVDRLLLTVCSVGHRYTVCKQVTVTVQDDIGLPMDLHTVT